MAKPMSTIVVGKSACDKSTNLIMMSCVQQKHIICKDRRRVNYLYEMSKRMGLDIPYPISFSELQKRRELEMRSIFFDGVLIDDALEILELFIRTNIICATATANCIKLEDLRVKY